MTFFREQQSAPRAIFPAPGSPEERDVLALLSAQRARVEAEVTTAGPTPHLLVSPTASGAQAERSSYFMSYGGGFYSLSNEIVSPDGVQIGATNRAVARTILDVLRHGTGDDIDEIGEDIEIGSELVTPLAQYSEAIDAIVAKGADDIVAYSVVYADKTSDTGEERCSVYDNPQDIIFNHPRALIEALRLYVRDGRRALQIEQNNPHVQLHRDAKLSEKRIRLCELMQLDLDSVAAANQE